MNVVRDAWCVMGRWGEAPAEPEARPCGLTRSSKAHPSGSAGASPHRPTARANRASSWVATTARKPRIETMNWATLAEKMRHEKIPFLSASFFLPALSSWRGGKSASARSVVAFLWPERGLRFSLSQRERAGVRESACTERRAAGWLWHAVLTVLLFASVSFAQPADFESANKLFEQGKFAEAAGAYERLLTNGPTAALHFNLGNARFKSGQPGQAIFHYHSALALAPRDPDARGNLLFARRSLGAAVEEPAARHLLRLRTRDEWAWLAGGTLGAWFILLALGEAWPGKRAAFGWLTKSAGALALGAAALLATAWWDRAATQLAVVVAAEAPVRPGPLAESKAAFSLRDGTELTVLDAKDDWLHVRDAGQRAGWLKRDAVRRLP